MYITAFANRLIATDNQSAASNGGKDSEARRMFDEMYDRSGDIIDEDLDFWESLIIQNEFVYIWSQLKKLIYVHVKEYWL